MSLYKAYLIFINEKETYNSSNTVYYYSFNLLRFFKFLSPDYEKLDVSALSLEKVQEYVRVLRGQKLKNVSINTYLRAIKHFVNWLFQEEMIPENFSERIKKLKNDSQPIVPLYQDEVEKIDDFFSSNSESALRDKCIFHLMLDAGLRLGEVVALKLSGLMFDKNLISVQGKGDKFRLVMMSPVLKSLLYRYVVFYRDVSFPDAPVFVQLLPERPALTDNCVKQLFSRVKKNSGVSRVYPHLCRHTFATSYIMGGGNLEFLRLLLGHTDYNVTKDYLHLANYYQLLGAEIYKLDKIFFKSMY